MGKVNLGRNPADEFIANSKYKDLQKACIVRGIGFDKLVEGSYLSLCHFLRKEWVNPINENRLQEFDDWRMKIMRELGKENEPFIRLAYTPENPEEGVIAKIKNEKPKSDKPKRELDNSLGIMGGTKKHLTYNCQTSGKTLEETVKIVMEKFPEAQPKSISIWYKRSKKASPK